MKKKIKNKEELLAKALKKNIKKRREINNGNNA